MEAKLEMSELEVLLKQYTNNEKELKKYQREYKLILETKLQSRKESVIQRAVLNNLEMLRKEKIELKSQLYVTNAPIHQKEISHHLEILACHVRCQDKLAIDIDVLRNQIATLEKQLRALDKIINDLKQKAVTEYIHRQIVKKAARKREILENQLDINKIQEAKYFAENSKLRYEVLLMLQHREIFNKCWRKMITKLNSNKKYLTDLSDYSCKIFDHANDIYLKSNAIKKKQAREVELRKHEMQGVLQKIMMNESNHEFLRLKANQRPLDDLESREYKRRDIVRNVQNNRIELYTKIIQKILAFSDVNTVNQAIASYSKQESLYYSYFNYSNDLTFKLTNINNRIRDLYKVVDNIRGGNTKRLEDQIALISKYEKELSNENIITKQKMDQVKAKGRNLENLFIGIQTICDLSNCDSAPLMILLGDHSQVTLFNVERFLRLLEKRLNQVIASVFIAQKKLKPEQKTVKDTTRISNEPSAIQDVVLVQMCPECAEGEDVNPYDTSFVQPFNSEEVRQKIKEKVPQPEMQYRLHSISQCRLPRSRYLASKRLQ